MRAYLTGGTGSPVSEHRRPNLTQKHSTDEDAHSCFVFTSRQRSFQLSHFHRPTAQHGVFVFLLIHNLSIFTIVISEPARRRTKVQAPTQQMHSRRQHSFQRRQQGRKNIIKTKRAQVRTVFCRYRHHHSARSDSSIQNRKIGTESRTSGVSSTVQFSRHQTPTPLTRYGLSPTRGDVGGFLWLRVGIMRDL